MSKRDYYISQVPGEDADRDAFNLLQAIRHDDKLMASLMIRHQITDDGLEKMVATLAAWLTIALRATPEKYANITVAHFRAIAELPIERRYDPDGGI